MKAFVISAHDRLYADQIVSRIGATGITRKMISLLLEEVSFDTAKPTSADRKAALEIKLKYARNR